MLRLIAFLILLLALGAGYTAFVLGFSYSSGDRAGVLQKFSRKGWICKTWEGEIALVSMPGTVAEKFAYTVRDDAVAQAINESLGKRVTLHYEQHIGLPTTCFGDTQYFVTELVGVADTP